MNKNMTSISFRKATISDFEAIWEIILYAKARRKSEGSTQWQDGYPNTATIKADIDNAYGYIAENSLGIIGYFALKFEKEPEYEEIQGKWLTNAPYAVVHRVAVSEKAQGMGLGRKILEEVEVISLEKGVQSVRIDTNFDNIAMLTIVERLGYQYCGEVCFRGATRKAFEKVLSA